MTNLSGRPSAPRSAPTEQKPPERSLKPTSTQKQLIKPLRRHVSSTEKPLLLRSVSESRLFSQFSRRHRQSHSPPIPEPRAEYLQDQRPRTAARSRADSPRTASQRPRTAPYADQAVADGPDPRLKPLPPLPASTKSVYVPTHAAADAAADFSRAHPRTDTSHLPGSLALETPTDADLGENGGSGGTVLQTGWKARLDSNSAEPHSEDPEIEDFNKGPKIAPKDPLPDQQMGAISSASETSELSDYQQFLLEAEEKERAVREEFMRRVETARHRLRPQRSDVFAASPLVEVPETDAAGLRGSNPTPATLSITMRRDRDHLGRKIAPDLRHDSLLRRLDRKDKPGGREGGRSKDNSQATTAYTSVSGHSTGHPFSNRAKRQSKIAQRVAEYIRPARLANGFDASATSRV